MRPPRVKYLPARMRGLVEGLYPNFGPNGSARGMRKQFYGDGALLVRCGQYVYNVSARPDIYEMAH